MQGPREGTERQHSRRAGCAEQRRCTVVMGEDDEDVQEVDGGDGGR